MEHLTFDKAGEDNVRTVMSILQEATQHKLRRGDTSWAEAIWSDEYVLGLMANSTAYIVHCENKAVGTVSLQWEDERLWGPQPPIAGYIHRLAIRDGFHGLGLGKTVIDWVLLQSTIYDKEAVRLDCDAGNIGLCAYYERHKFVRVGSNASPDHVSALYERTLTTDSLK